MSGPVLSAANLDYGFRGKTVGRGFNFALHENEVMAVLGPNGAGKTTLFRTLLGLLPPHAGEITLMGKPLREYSQAELARTLTYVPQAHDSYFPFAARDVVLMGRTAHLRIFASPGARDRELADAALNQLRIEHLADRPFDELSGGEQQLVLIARALATEAKVFILDEPTANLDYGNQLMVLAEIARLKAAGKSVLFCTHHPEHAIRCSERFLTIRSDAKSSESSAQLYDYLSKKVITHVYGESASRDTHLLAAINRSSRSQSQPDTLEARGYLASEAEQWLESIRSMHRDWFVLAEDLCYLSHKTMLSIQIGKDDPDSLVLGLLLSRANSAAQCAVSTLERGFVVEARIIARALLEAVFSLVAVHKKTVGIDELLLDDNFNRKRVLKNLTQLAPELIEHHGLSHEFLNAQLEEIGNAGIAELRVRLIAERAGMINHYLSLYSLLSSATHVRIRDMEKQIEADQEGNLSRLNWGPLQQDIVDTLVAIVDCCMISVRAVIDEFSLSEKEAEFEGLHLKYQSLLKSKA